MVSLYFLYTELVLLENALTGSISSAIGNYTELQNLNLGINNLEGTIPSEIGKLVELRFLNLPDCGLSGTLPTEVGNMNKIGKFPQGVFARRLGRSQASYSLVVERSIVGKFETNICWPVHSCSWH